MTKYVISKTFDNKVSTLKRNQTTAKKLIQELSEEALDHMENNENDTTALNMLYNALGNGIRKKDYISWVSQYMPVFFTKKKSKAGATIYTFKVDKKDTAVPFDIHGMRTNPFDDYVKERNRKELEDMTAEQVDALVINYLEAKKKQYEKVSNTKVVKLLEAKIEALAA